MEGWFNLGKSINVIHHANRVSKWQSSFLLLLRHLNQDTAMVGWKCKPLFWPGCLSMPLQFIPQRGDRTVKMHAWIRSEQSCLHTDYRQQYPFIHPLTQHQGSQDRQASPCLHKTSKALEPSYLIPFPPWKQTTLLWIKQIGSAKFQLALCI